MILAFDQWDIEINLESPSSHPASRYPFFVVATLVLFLFSDLGLGTVVNIAFRAGDPELSEEVFFCDFLVGTIGENYLMRLNDPIIGY